VKPLTLITRVTAVVLLAGCERVAPAAPIDDGLVAVSAREVCMVNDRHIGAPQIPIQVGEKTYFGCCAGCVKRLIEDESARTAQDRYTLRAVDKASALIMRQPTGEVLYFESAETLSAYRNRER
jgi:hypothetical protein